MLHVQHNVCINILCLYPHNTPNIVLLFFFVVLQYAICSKTKGVEWKKHSMVLTIKVYRLSPVLQRKSRWLTVVYRGLDEDEVRELINHKNCSAASWSHAIHDRDHYKAMLKEDV